MHTCYSELVRERARVLYSNETQSVSHRMDHVERVLYYAQTISAHYTGVDPEVLTIAVLLHDITSPFDRKPDHVRLSMITAREVLGDIGYPPERREKVLAIIAEHSTEQPRDGILSSTESRILFDADKIDGAGAVGIARAFAFSGQQGHAPSSAIAWYRQKIGTALCHMQTSPGRAMLMERLAYVENFLDRFEAEDTLSTNGSRPHSYGKIPGP